MKETIQTIKECPSCKTSIVNDPNYITWCLECNWNLKYEDTTEAKTKWEEFYLKISKIQSESLFEKVINEDLFDLKKTKLISAAYLISMCIILVNLSLFITGIYALFLNWGGVSNYLLAIILLCLFWLTKPKLRKIPKDSFISKNKFPQLYNLVDSICNELNTSNIEGIILDEKFNASITEYGLSRKKVLTLGLPLWNILNDHEKLDLLGHEISHCVNGDPARNIVVGTAINILIDTGFAIYPNSLLPENTSNEIMLYIVVEVAKYLVIPLNILLRGFAKILWFWAYCLCQMIWIDSQRAEYLADLSATKISGKENAITAMEKLSLYQVIDFELHKLSLKNRKELENTNIFEILNHKVSNLPSQERERLKRILYLQEHRLDATHPPTGYRIKMLEKKGFTSGKFDKSKINFREIEKEIADKEKIIQDKLMDTYKSRLYY